MKTKTLVFSLLALSVILILFTWGNQRVQNPKPSPNNDRSQLQAKETRHNFGLISMKDGNVTADFLINNPSKSDITVSDIVTSCMCTTAFLIGKDGGVRGPFGMLGHNSTPIREVLAEGESRLVRVVYDPNAHGPAGLGTIDRSIILTDSEGRDLQLSIEAIVTP